MLPLIVLALYVVSLHAPFAYDDRIHILENPVVRAFHSLFDLGAIRGAFTSPSGLAGRPLLMVTYGMNHALSGTDPASFRWVNLAVHAANCLLVFLIVFRITNCEVKVSLFAAAIFAAHPLITESVTNIAGRSSVLCATFYFAGLYFSLYPRFVSLAVTVFCFAIGMLVKQEAVTLPAAAMAMVWLVWPQNTPRRTRWLASAILVVTTVAILVIQRSSLAEVSTTTQTNAALVAAGFEPTLGFRTYLLSSIAAFTTYYLWRFFIPISLSVDPEVATVSTLSIGVIASIIVIAVMTIVAVFFRKKRPLLTIGIGLLLVAPLTAYWIFPLADVVAEHRAYINVLGAAIIIADCVSGLRRPMIASAALLIALGWLTFQRNSVWNDEVLLWEDARNQAPTKMRPHVNLGALYQTRGQRERAIEEYRIVLRRNPAHDGALANLGALYLDTNDLRRAEQFLNRAVQANSNFSVVYLNLGVVRLRQGRFAEARELLERAESLNPRQLMVHLNLGDALFNEGQPARAVEHFLAEIELNPDLALTRIHLAKTYEVMGMLDKSLEQYRAAARLDPFNVEVRSALQKFQ